KLQNIRHEDLKNIGYSFNKVTDKWNISDAAADFIYIGTQPLSFALPGTLKVILDAATWEKETTAITDKEEKRLFTETYFPIYDIVAYQAAAHKSSLLNFVMLDGNAT